MLCKSIKLCGHNKAISWIKHLNKSTSVSIPCRIKISLLLWMTVCKLVVCVWVCVSWIKVCNTWLIPHLTSELCVPLSLSLATLLYTVCPVNLCSLPVNTLLLPPDFLVRDRNHHRAYQRKHPLKTIRALKQRSRKEIFCPPRAHTNHPPPRPTGVDQCYRCWTKVSQDVRNLLVSSQV